MLQASQQHNSTSSDIPHADHMADDTHSDDDDDNEICVVETDDKPCCSDDSYSHITTGRHIFELFF